MSLMIYSIIMIVVGFFTFKYQKENFETQAHKWEPDYRGGGLRIAYRDNYSWLERKAAWIVIVTAITWPILVPAIGLIFILEYFYKKININTKKKTNETITPEHEITNDDTISNPHNY